MFTCLFSFVSRTATTKISQLRQTVQNFRLLPSKLEVFDLMECCSMSMDSLLPALWDNM